CQQLPQCAGVGLHPSGLVPTKSAGWLLICAYSLTTLNPWHEPYEAVARADHTADLDHAPAERPGPQGVPAVWRAARASARYVAGIVSAHDPRGVAGPTGQHASVLWPAAPAAQRHLLRYSGWQQCATKRKHRRQNKRGRSECTAQSQLKSPYP